MDKNKMLQLIGNKIKLARIKKGLTQELLAEKCDVTPKYISTLENGKTAGSVPLIICICNVLEITPNYIFSSVLNTEKNNIIEIIDPQIITFYAKLKDENKDFVNKTITHLYNMQKKR